LLEELVTYMFASCSASVHYGITRKGWPPTCLQAAGLQFTTASCERAENVGDLHVCKLQCFSSLRHHAKGLATYMFASCRADSVHYGITRKGWRPTCLQAAGLHFMRASTGIVAGWLPCLLEDFCPHYSRGVADYLFAMSAAVGFNVLWKQGPQQVAGAGSKPVSIVLGAPNSEARWLTPRGPTVHIHVQRQCLVRRVALTVFLPSLGKFFCTATAFSLVADSDTRIYNLLPQPRLACLH
jgi:hypothetical protein